MRFPPTKKVWCSAAVLPGTVVRGAAGGRTASSSPRGAREGPCVWASASLPVEVDVRADAGREVAVMWPSRRRRAGTCNGRAHARIGSGRGSAPETRRSIAWSTTAKFRLDRGRAPRRTVRTGRVRRDAGVKCGGSVRGAASAQRSDVAHSFIPREPGASRVPPCLQARLAHHHAARPRTVRAARTDRRA